MYGKFSINVLGYWLGLSNKGISPNNLDGIIPNSNNHLMVGFFQGRLSLISFEY